MRRWSAALAVSLACGASAASASEGVDRAAATELFNTGRDMMKRGEYAAACPKLAESARLEPTVGALAKLAECEEHERRLASAHGRWQQALNLAHSLGDARAVDVQRELARLDAIVPKLRVLSLGALPADAVIRVDDVELGPATVGVPLAVEPGEHAVRVLAPHKVAWSTTVETSADGAITAVTVPVLEDASAPLPAPPVAPLPAPAGSPSGRVIGLVAAGAGVGALAVGGALGLLAMHQRDEAGCPGNLCPDYGSADTLRTAKATASWSTALFIAGGAVLAGGGSLWWFSRDQGGGGVRAVATPLGIAGSF